MSIRWIEGAMTRSKSQGTARLILVVLANNADDETGTCYPGIRYIAQRAGVGLRTAQRAIRELEELGELTTKVQASHLGTNIYQLTFSLVDPLSSAPPPSSAPPCQIDTPPPVKLTPKPSVNKPSVNKNAEKQQDAEIPDDWEPSGSDVEYAEKHGMTPSTIRFESDAFAHYHRAKGNTSKSWSLRWMYWVRNWVEHGAKQAPKKPYNGKMTKEEIESGRYD
jgi:Helix-turn-helix domain